jgi:hypothetical protein
MDEFCDAVIEISKEHDSILITLEGSDGIAIPYRIKERLGEGRTICFNLGVIGWLHDGEERTIYFSTPTSFHLVLTAYHFKVIYVDAYLYREDEPTRDLLNAILEEGSSQVFTFDREKDFEVAWLNTLVKSSNKV